MESKNILEGIENLDELVVVSVGKEDISESRKCNQTYLEEEELRTSNHIEFSNMKQKSFESNLEKRNVISVNKETKRKFVKSLSLSRCDTIEEQVETLTETIAQMKKKIQKIFQLMERYPSKLILKVKKKMRMFLKMMKTLNLKLT